MAFKEIPNTAKAIYNLSKDVEGKKELLDALHEVVNEASTLHGRALKLDIEKEKLGANYKRFRTQVERLLENFKKDRSKANLKQRVTYNTRLLQQAKELAGPLNAFANEIYDVASRASASVLTTCLKGVVMVGGILGAILAPGGKVAIVTSVLTSGGGFVMLILQAYNSYSSTSTENELRKLAGDTQEFILKFDKLMLDLKDRDTELEVEKQRDC